MSKKAQFYSPEELAEKLKLNIITIYRYIRAKKNPSKNWGEEKSGGYLLSLHLAASTIGDERLNC